MSTSITFHGATGTVTGSRTLIASGSSRVLVDCGLFQGPKTVRSRNWQKPAFDPATLDAVVLTHAHIDHSGYVPRLRKLGFHGPIYCTPGTRDLLHILLPDAGYLQEEDARRANRHGYTRHQPAEALYTFEEANRSLGQLVSRPFHEEFEAAPGVTVRFTRAGHILGSACIELHAGGVSVAFTGDVGRPADPVMRAPEPLPRTDYLVTESTYGDRVHSVGDVESEVEHAINDAVRRGGAILVPAFAVGRSQHLMHVVTTLREAGRIPPLPVFLDSPMAIKATAVLYDHADDHRLDEAQRKTMFATVQYARTPEQSKAIGRRRDPVIIISASGMATGGRVLHHLAHMLPHERNTVLFVGFQAPGTRGQALVDGADEVKIHGVYVPVRAHVQQLRGLSAHADYRELTSWFQKSGVHPARTFVTHGELAAADALRRRLEDVLGWTVTVPEGGTPYPLEAKRT